MERELYSSITLYKTLRFSFHYFHIIWRKITIHYAVDQMLHTVYIKMERSTENYYDLHIHFSSKRLLLFPLIYIDILIIHIWTKRGKIVFNNLISKFYQLLVFLFLSSLTAPLPS